MRKALIETDLIVNFIEADGGYTPPSGHSVADAQPGWEVGGLWDGATYTPSPDQAEATRRRGLSVEDEVDEDILKPFISAVRSPIGHITRAVFETLVDAINIERVARGASAIPMSTAIASVKAKLVANRKQTGD